MLEISSKGRKGSKIELLGFKKNKFYYRKSSNDGDPRRGFWLYHDFFHGLEVWKNIMWIIELWWVVVILAFKVFKFDLYMLYLGLELLNFTKKYSSKN